MAGSQGDVLQMWTEAEQVVVDNQQVVFLLLGGCANNSSSQQTDTTKRFWKKKCQRGGEISIMKASQCIVSVIG
jgi:hypothetical protein